jgi:hypothetical protein
MKNIVKIRTFFVFLSLFAVFSSYGMAGMDVTIDRIALKKGTFSFDEPVLGAVYVRNTGTVPFYDGYLFIDVTKNKENTIPSKSLEAVGYYVIRGVSLLPGEQKGYPINASIASSCGKGQYRVWVELAGKGTERRDYKNREFLMQGGQQAIEYPVIMNVYENPQRKYGTPVISPGSEITATAEIKNILSKEAAYTLQFTVYDPFDEALWEKPLIIRSQQVKLAPNEKKTLDIKLPMNVKPGSYTILLTVLKDNSVIALRRMQNIHVDGISGTIDDIYPDKDAYNAGETMVLHYSIGGPQSPSNLKREKDAYPETETYLPANTVPSPLNFQLSVDYVKDGKVIQTETKDLEITDIYGSPTVVGDWKILVNEAMYNYTLKSSVLDMTGNILDTLEIRTYSNKELSKTTATTRALEETSTQRATTQPATTEASAPETTFPAGENPPAKTDSNIFVVIIIFAAITILGWYLMKKPKKDNKGECGAGMIRMSLMFIIAAALLGAVVSSHAGGSCQCSEGNVVCSCGNGEPQVCEQEEQQPPETGSKAGKPSAVAAGDYIIRESYCECDDEKCLFANNCNNACCKTKVTDCSARVCLNGNLYTGQASDGACQMTEFGCTSDCCKEYCGGSCGVCSSGGCVCNYACMTGKDCGTSSDPCADYICQNAGTCQASCSKSDDKKPNLKLDNSDVSESAGSYLIQAAMKNTGRVGAVIDQISLNLRSYDILNKPNTIASGSGSIFTAKTDSGTMLSIPGALKATIDYSSEENRACKVTSIFDLGGVAVLKPGATEQVYAMDAAGMCENHYFSCYNSRPDGIFYLGYKCYKGENYDVPTRERINLGFGLTSLPSGRTIKSAVLSFVVSNVIKPQDVTVYTNARDDWANKPTCEAVGDVCGPSYCKEECSQIFDIGGSQDGKINIAMPGTYSFDVTDYISKEYAGDKYASVQLRGDEDVWARSGQQSCTKPLEWEPADIRVDLNAALVVTYS